MPPLNRLRDLTKRSIDALPRTLLFGSIYGERLRLIRSSRAGRLNLARYQRQALASTLAHALRSVPFYRRNYDVDPDRIDPDNAIDTLQRFDFLDKATVAADPEQFVSTAVARSTLLSKVGAGSTGRGLLVYYDRRELAIERSYVEYPWYEFGFRPHALVVQAGVATRRPLDQSPFCYGLRRVYLSGDHCTSESMGQIVEVLTRLQPEFIHGYPSIWEAVARGFRERGLRLPVRAALLGSEQLLHQQIPVLTETFGPICIGYGLTERAALAYGSVGNRGVTYVLEPTYAYNENVISDTGLPEIAGTNLFVRVMPLIRYRTEDVGVIQEDGVLGSIDGRAQEILITRAGGAVAGTAVDFEYWVWDYVESYQFVQCEPGKIQLHVIPGPNYTPEVEARMLASQRRLMGELFDFELVRLDHLEKPRNAKRRLVVGYVYRRRRSSDL